MTTLSLLCLCAQEILNYINRKEFEPLLKVDQLNLEREKNKVFLRFGKWVFNIPILVPPFIVHRMIFLSEQD